MKIKFNAVVAIILTIGGLSWLGYANSDSVPSGIPRFRGLFSADKDVQMQTEINALKERQEAIDELLHIVQTQGIEKTNGDALVSAINLLGVYRAKQASIDIVNHLAFRPDSYMRRIIRAIPPQEKYPAVIALLSIGDARGLSKTLIYKIGYSVDPLERELAAYVLAKIKGREQAEEIINNAYRNVFSKDVKEYYKTAGEFVKTVSFKISPPKLNSLSDPQLPTKEEVRK